MAIENRLNPSQPVINLDDLACERIETRLKAQKSVFEGVEPAIYVRFKIREFRFKTRESGVDAGETSTGRAVLQYPGQDIYHHRENRQANREIKLGIVHVLFQNTPAAPESRNRHPCRGTIRVSAQQEISPQCLIYFAAVIRLSASS
jgi:hypothetical protein